MRVSISGDPVLELLMRPGRARWRLWYPLKVRSSLVDFEVPAGFVTNGTSIPWWVPYPRREGLHTRASIAHDCLYQYGCALLQGSEWSPANRRRAADQLFLAAMKADGAPFIRRVLFYLAARAFGWLWWHPCAP